ncbi:hypothetical protein PHSY_003608 [Pseudozyma hubeiensis SY62]|uniref:Uncharacterized protein n=1 Tax=Pseudozyma hubeiensis (strain SY62) TaxID=1305764 RepID=R9P404_PSEHS|nr:hypothetical protein PHSY_003608 [Pseudozyma hubeiensis SY62]GAC96029.1 hypothetical protein PHSY_003608 [Pseudozyma hubeiensis SY62]
MGTLRPVGHSVDESGPKAHVKKNRICAYLVCMIVAFGHAASIELEMRRGERCNAQFADVIMTEAKYRRMLGARRRTLSERQVVSSHRAGRNRSVQNKLLPHTTWCRGQKYQTMIDSADHGA